MRQLRVALVAALGASLGVALAACSTGPISSPPGDGQAGGSGPVVTISPGPAPESLCDLLTPADFDTLAGLKVTTPKSTGATDSKASCVYGTDIQVDVFIEGSADAAHQTYLTAIQNGKLNAIQTNLLGGVDESVYGTLPKSVGMSLRRTKLVITIELPKSVQQDGHVRMIKLAGQALQRAGGLGT